MRRFFLSIMCAISPFVFLSAQTLAECQRAAERNYPLVRKYGMLEQMSGFTVENISKGWLPQVTAVAQATVQSDVASWPDAMTSMLKQMGVDAVGLRKDQYKVGIDVLQTVYDGGAISREKAVAYSQNEVLMAQNDVDIYAVRHRVNEMYFGLLLLKDKMLLNDDVMALLSASEQKLSSMFRHGAVAESDYLAMKAERLETERQKKDLMAQYQTVMRMLSALCGMEVTSVAKPPVVSYEQTNSRPELRLIDRQLQLADAQDKALDSRLLPHFSLFASGYYGYPGYNMFDDMMRCRLTLNGMVGARLTWNIGALYTRKSDKSKLKMQRSLYELQRELFLFNNRLEQIQEDDNIERYRMMIADDEEIISLRTVVRKSAESKLAHGIIDTSELIRYIGQENSAKTQRSIHEIEMLRGIYNRNYTLNN